MTNNYMFDYDFSKAECVIIVDREKFTEELANETLTFFSWNYDKDADPIDEVVKKYAMMVLKEATEGLDLYSIKNRTFEGFLILNGRFGIELISVEGFELDEDDLSVSKS